MIYNILPLFCFIQRLIFNLLGRSSITRYGILLCTVWWGTAWAIHPAYAQEKSPILLEADSVKQLPQKVIIAQGHVKLSNGQSHLFADMASIDQKTKIITVAGNISLYTPDHHIVFAQYMKVTPDLNFFIAKNLGLRTPDNITILSHKTQISQNKQTYKKALYTKCQVQKGDKPLWCVSASTIEHDAFEKKYYFYNILLKIHDIPVFYIPYMSKYDQTVKRKRGFLDATNGFSKRLGYYISIPYFMPFKEDKNLIFNTILTQKNNVIPSLSYQEKFSRGYLSTTALYLYDNTKYNEKSTAQRYYGQFGGSYDLTDHLRVNAHLERTSDKSFIAQYSDLTQQPSTTNYLASRLQLEGFWDKTYLEFHALSLQNLQTDDYNTDTQVLPEVSFFHDTPPDFLGGHFSFSGNAHITQSQYHPTEQVYMLQQRYFVPITIKGIETNLKTFIQENSFHTSPIDGTKSYDGITHKSLSSNRFYQRTGVEVKYPFVNDNQPIIITPIVAYYSSLAGKNDVRLISDNTPFPTFDENSLFSLNRFSSNGIFDTSQRLVYALKTEYRNTDYTGISLLLAQNNILSKPDMSERFFGDQRSHNYYASLSIAPIPALTFNNSSIFNNRDGKLMFNQSSLAYTNSIFSIKSQYILFDRLIEQSSYTNSLETTASIQITPRLSFAVTDQRAFSPTLNAGSRALGNNFTLTYENDCLTLKGIISRTNTTTAYIKPSTSYMFNITLKSLTSFSFKPQ